MTILERMLLAVELVKQRLLKVSAFLDEAGIDNAVVGGNAVAAWVATVDVSAVRNTQDVDILLNQADLPDAVEALQARGLVYRHVASVDNVFGRPRG